MNDEIKIDMFELTTEIFQVLNKHGLFHFLVFDKKKEEFIAVDSLSIIGRGLQLNINEKLKEIECQMKC